MNALRDGARSKDHQLSTLFSGIWIGAAIPAFIAGLYHSTLEETREHIHGWDALLMVYGIFFLPIVLSLLVGLNLYVWARARINYTFIFGLDVRSRIDYQEYFEIPTFLFATLCSAFWLSFSRTGSSHVSPTTWPLVWLALTVATMLNPLPFKYRSSRFWLLKATGKLCISYTHRVQFTEFWLADQFCSLLFTLSNLPVFVCVYAQHFPDDWTQTCAIQSTAWPAAFALTALPISIRLAQSIKRYRDSRLFTHLINAGKYGLGVISYLFYYLWLHQAKHDDIWLPIWLIFMTFYSLYAIAWDFLMDWSLLRRRSKHFLLRNELGYPTHKFAYYFAIVTNCIIRFVWLIYVPERGPNMILRQFIYGFLEMLRRAQWNFYRLENEHIGNLDQYRFASELPFPIAFNTTDTQSNNRSRHFSDTSVSPSDKE